MDLKIIFNNLTEINSRLDKLEKELCRGIEDALLEGSEMVCDDAENEFKKKGYSSAVSIDYELNKSYSKPLKAVEIKVSTDKEDIDELSESIVKSSIENNEDYIEKLISEKIEKVMRGVN